MTQEQFDNIYDTGIESNKISLTESKVITVNDLLDAAIYKMHFQENMNIKEIKKALKEQLNLFVEHWQDEITG